MDISSPSAKLPPGYSSDFYGKRRQLAKLQVLERQVGILEDELKSLEDLQLASSCCKELDDFIETRQDPFITKDQKVSESNYFRKWLWAKFRAKDSWIWCCFCGYRPSIEGGICCPSEKSHGHSCGLKISSCLRYCDCAELASPHTCTKFGSCSNSAEVKL